MLPMHSVCVTCVCVCVLLLFGLGLADESHRTIAKIRLFLAHRNIVNKLLAGWLYDAHITHNSTVLITRVAHSSNSHTTQISISIVFRYMNIFFCLSFTFWFQFYILDALVNVLAINFSLDLMYLFFSGFVVLLLFLLLCLPALALVVAQTSKFELISIWCDVMCSWAKCIRFDYSSCNSHRITSTTHTMSRFYDSLPYEYDDLWNFEIFFACL